VLFRYQQSLYRCIACQDVSFNSYAAKCLLPLLELEMARAANSQVFGPSAKVLKQSASNFFSDVVITGRCSLLAKNFCVLQSFII